MLDRALVAIVLALLKHLEARGISTAVDADRDPVVLDRAGSRLREWLRSEDRLRAGRKPDEAGTERQG
jgi:hypothetical protein